MGQQDKWCFKLEPTTFFFFFFKPWVFAHLSLSGRTCSVEQLVYDTNTLIFTCNSPTDARMTSMYNSFKSLFKSWVCQLLVLPLLLVGPFRGHQVISPNI